MKLSKTDWYIVLFFLLAFVMTAINNIFALFLLFPAYWLCEKGFGKENPK